MGTCCMVQETQTGALYQPRVVGLGGSWREVQKRGDICIPMADFMLRFEIKQQNSVKQLSFSSVAQSCPTLCDPMNHSTPGLPVYHQLPESTQTHVHRFGDAIQPSRPLLFLSPPAFNLSQHQGLFQWISSSHQVARVLEFLLQYQSFQWIFRIDSL